MYREQITIHTQPCLASNTPTPTPLVRRFIRQPTCRPSLSYRRGAVPRLRASHSPKEASSEDHAHETLTRSRRVSASAHVHVIGAHVACCRAKRQLSLMAGILVQMVAGGSKIIGRCLLGRSRKLEGIGDGVRRGRGLRRIGWGGDPEKDGHVSLRWNLHASSPKVRGVTSQMMGLDRSSSFRRCGLS